MELNDDARIDTSQIEDRRGSGGGRAGIPIPIGGGRGGIVGLVIFVLITLVGGGFGVSQLTGGDGEQQGDNTALEQRCETSDALQHLDCRNTLFVNSIQAYWKRALPEHFDRPYEESDTVFFEQAVSTGCGQADSGVGPFYCPLDDKIYIDLSFYRVLAEQLGAPGEFAQPYVLAHEYGHHVQDLLGTEQRVRDQRQADPAEANRLSVLLELQADCYAGAWARNATGTADDRGVKIFTSLTQQDIQEGLDTAAAIGDDAIQQKSGGRIDESQFTHGSSADRQKWFGTGYSSGDPTDCDTFGAAR
ncbi:neutral zinc metallopeptidase [Plantactinospora sp. WMMC1484]|uniref:KPN_02809 family neutral zinc metallopeptidase n=1 Tax=Plantactinospora sp. WMMC1484 TaxID=3404122 RepID=UPI003BF504CF